MAKLGLRGLELSCSWDMEPMWHPVWEPLWQAVNEVNLPLHFHTFPVDAAGRARQGRPGLTRRAALFTGVSGFQMNLVNILAAIIGAAVLERYPNLRISFGESGIGWIPYALDRMDFEWEDRFRDLGLTMKPSDYWRRQCKATFQFDRIGTKLIDDMGVETLMWALRLPAHRRRVARVVEVHRGAVRPPARRRRPQDHLRERGEVLRADQVARVRRVPSLGRSPRSARVRSRLNAVRVFPGPVQPAMLGRFRRIRRGDRDMTRDDRKHPYAWRTRLRARLPWLLLDLGIAAKGADCEAAGGEHDWYNIDDVASGCYDCRVVREGQHWKPASDAS